MDVKTISIVGQPNRYFVKKAMCLNTEPVKLKNIFPKHLYEEDMQLKIVELLMGPTNTDNYSILNAQLLRKMSGYKSQDVSKGVYNEVSFFAPMDALKKMHEMKMLCIYCEIKMLFVYEHARNMKQWTLDRLNNDLGHDKENVVISCLACNLSKRRRSHSAFLNTKQLIIVRADYSS